MSRRLRSGKTGKSLKAREADIGMPAALCRKRQTAPPLEASWHSLMSHKVWAFLHGGAARPPARGHRIRLQVVFLVLSGILAFGAVPSSPLVRGAAADATCTIIVVGGRAGPITAWGQGLLSCVGDVAGTSQTLTADPCSLDVGICWIWGNGPQFAYCTRTTTLSYWCPAQNAYAYNLKNGTLYRIQNHVFLHSYTGGYSTGDAYTGSFRL